jgi:hypothetical protein
MKRAAAISALAVYLWVGGAGAADPPPQNLEPIGRGEATGILGKTVVGSTGEALGRVVDVLVDADGQPRAAVVDFGGFLGVGSRKIAVTWRLLEFRPSDHKAPIRLGATRAEIQAAPEYKEEEAKPAEVVTPPTVTPPQPGPLPPAPPPSPPPPSAAPEAAPSPPASAPAPAPPSPPAEAPPPAAPAPASPSPAQ